MSRSSHRVAIVVAIIGVIGTIGAALIGNWDKIFPRLHIVDGPRSPELSKKPAETVVRDVRRDPEKTTQALLKAWNNRDQDTALKLAEESAVNKLFSASARNPEGELEGTYLLPRRDRSAPLPDCWRS